MPLDNVQLPKRNDHDNYDFMAIEVHPRSDASSESVAKDVAASQNLLFMGRIGALDNHYLLAMPKTRTLIKRDPVAVTGDLSDHPEVHWVERQVPDKRLFKRFPSSSSTPSMNVISSPSFNTSLGKRGSIGKIPMALEKLDFKDPGFPEQFHLFNRVEIGHDMNLTGVWAQGITGKGVVTTFLDDGVDHDHPDLKNNFFLEGSYDFNEHKKYPTPALSDDFHGTRCAGEVAAEKNDICGVGIAWDSKVSGIRILSGTLTVADEAAAINYEFHKNHIFSCSWGPRDDGRTMDAPPKLAAEAFKKGIVDGRDGKGSIFVFAAGNGGGSGDNWYAFLFVHVNYVQKLTNTCKVTLMGTRIAFTPSLLEPLSVGTSIQCTLKCALLI